MASSLESLLAEGVISEIYSRLKSGKEADVYAVLYGDQVVAAKVYKDRAQRSFKSNAVYKEGRAVRNSRSQRAMDRGSKFGHETAEEAWKSAEATALYKLHAAGVRVPVPVMFLEGVLFMELVRGADGQAAPRLIDTDLDPVQARAAYLDMLAQLVRILSCDLIHGDLSPYNVLWAASGPTIIDFPQIVAAAQNSNSESFFHRDARNILGHFAAIDPGLRGRLNYDAREIWRAYVRRELTPDFLPSGQPPRPEPRPRFAEQRPGGQRENRQAPPARDDRRPGPQHPRPANQAAGSRPASHSGNQPLHGPAPRLQMASARANIASHSAENRGPGRSDARAQQERAAQERPQQARPQPQRPQQERTAQRPQQERAAQERPQQQRPPQQQATQERPQQQRPQPQRAAQERPQPQRAAQERPQPQRAAQERPQPQRQQQRRGPEVIVLTRRATEAVLPAGDDQRRQHAEQVNDEPTNSVRRRPR